jgi:CheY-like chemotaxis protein
MKGSDVEEERTQVQIPVEGVARILIVDDEEVVRATLKAILERLGYEVTLCSDGREAVDFYTKSWRDVDLVIIDMVMPQMGGLDTFLAMQAVNPSVRAILSSGYSMGGDAQKILDSGVRSFVQKPFHVVQLSRAVAEALKR